MSAAEIIEQIKKLPPEERQKVRSCLDQLEGKFKENDTPSAGSGVKSIPSETFEAAKKKVFAENQELLSRLAK